MVYHHTGDPHGGIVTPLQREIGRVAMVQAHDAHGGRGREVSGAMVDDDRYRAVARIEQPDLGVATERTDGCGVVTPAEHFAHAAPRSALGRGGEGQLSRAASRDRSRSIA